MKHETPEGRERRLVRQRVNSTRHRTVEKTKIKAAAVEHLIGRFCDPVTRTVLGCVRLSKSNESYKGDRQSFDKLVVDGFCASTGEGVYRLTPAGRVVLDAMMARRPRARDRASAPDDKCVECDGTGHRDGCDVREPAYDLGDLICRSPCTGCCPNGCGEDTEREDQRAVASKLRSFARPPRAASRCA